MFFQIGVSLSRIPLKFERHAPTLQHGKSRVHRHNAKAERPRPTSAASGFEDPSQADCYPIQRRPSRRLRSFQQSQETLDDFIGFLITVGSVKMLYKTDTMFAKCSITSMVLNRTSWWVERFTIQL
jgi:hypothetical protein